MKAPINEHVYVTSIVEFDKDILDSVKAHYENDKLFRQVI
jgi:hypothetical protein